MAEKHNVQETVLLRGVFSPVMENVDIKNKMSKRGNTYREYLMNGFSVLSLELIQNIELLTGREDIQYTTMINWSGIFNKNVVYHKRRWCPLCLESFQKDLGIVYEPLIWSISDIKICDIHQITLKEYCPSCGEKLAYIHSNLVVGYCQHCFQWLGESGSYDNKISLKGQNFILENYKELLEVAPALYSFPNRDYIGDFLNKLREQLEFDSIRQFSIFLGVNYSGLYYWLNKERSPDPEKLLHLAQKLGCTIYEIISNEDLYLKVEVDDFVRERQVSRKSVKEIENYLREAAYTNSVPKSLKKVCKEGGFSRTVAQQNYPYLTQLIMDNSALYRKNSFTQRKKDIENTLKEILDQEIPKSLKKNLDDYGISVRTAQKYNPKLCQMIIKRYKLYIAEEKIKRIKGYEDEIKGIILDLHRKDIYPSIYKIKKVISKPNIFLESHFESYRKQILKSLGYKL